MTSKTLLIAVASTLAAGAITASAMAQSAGEAMSASALASQGSKPGDADGAFVTMSKFSEPDGEKMYRRVCAGCHMPDAKGVSTGAGFYPALAANKNLMSSGYPVYVVLKGKNGMPAVGAMMTDQQVADVVNYVRTHFGNRYKDPVKAEDVKAVR
ncbi:c-type cytochrome [Novosphingobium piscinae]|nr:cytochrome c [Novosphingobium piscinae]